MNHQGYNDRARSNDRGRVLPFALYRGRTQGLKVLNFGAVIEKAQGKARTNSPHFSRDNAESHLTLTTHLPLWNAASF